MGEKDFQRGSSTSIEMRKRTGEFVHSTIYRFIENDVYSRTFCYGQYQTPSQSH